MVVKAVVFDIGNVLMEWNPERFYDRVLGPERRRALFEAVDLHGMNESVDLGAPFRETVYALAAAHPEWAAEIRLWHDRWLEMAQPAIPGSVALLRALRAKGVPVFALSNFGVGSFEIARRAYPFLDEFDRRYVSGMMRMQKPDPQIYAAVEADCALAGPSLLFTDDRADNIAAAAARGWQTHLFDGAERLAAALRGAGLLQPEDIA